MNINLKMTIDGTLIAQYEDTISSKVTAKREMSQQLQMISNIFIILKLPVRDQDNKVLKFNWGRWRECVNLLVINTLHVYEQFPIPFRFLFFKNLLFHSKNGFTLEKKIILLLCTVLYLIILLVHFIFLQSLINQFCGCHPLLLLFPAMIWLLVFW